MPTQTIITDEQLTKMLEESYLDLGQKFNLIPLIPVMNEEERTGLLDLIKQAEQIQQNAEHGSISQEDILKLNEEYNHKMDQILKEETSHTLHEFEHLSHDQDVAELEELEKEMESIKE